ncbi:hypothetical protein LSM04_002219 [Trypanosoma melophagium]|uniref:uncharacterized protein n=1 Tax=Trypanosoma melophagium TaxID=715481 RepID=UPI00351A0E13|nr:hypothetical protein LSM04_002219 [Trypanosoma melophagium]
MGAYRGFMFQHSFICLRHPYAIDQKELAAAKRQIAKRAQITLKSVFILSARRAWVKAKSGYNFFFPGGGKGGPSR